MTKETMRIIVEMPELLNRLGVGELRSWELRAIKDLPEPRLLVSELGPMGVPLAVVFPIEDYREFCDVYRRIFDAVAALEKAVIL